MIAERWPLVKQDFFAYCIDPEKGKKKTRPKQKKTHIVTLSCHLSELTQFSERDQTLRLSHMLRS